MEIKKIIPTYNGHLKATKIPLQESLLNDSLSILHSRSFDGYEEVKDPSPALIFDGVDQFFGVLPPFMIDPNGNPFKIEKFRDAISEKCQLSYKNFNRKIVYWMKVRDASEQSLRQGIKELHNKVRLELERQGIPFTYVRPLSPSYAAIQNKYEATVL